MDASSIAAVLRNPSNPFTVEDLHQLNQAINDRFRYESRHAVLTFTPGDRVSWEGSGGVRITGSVVRTNRSTVSVRSDTGMTWRVSASLLSRLP